MSAHKGVTLGSNPVWVWPTLAEPTAGSAPRGRASARGEDSAQPYLLRPMAFQQPDTVFYFSSLRKQPLETAGEGGQVEHVYWQQ